MDERIKKQLAFSLEIDKEKNVFRQTHLSGHGRNENDAEHAWHMAVMAYLLKEHSNEPVDIARVMIMCLTHDLVEIDAGDTYAYDAKRLASQKEREAAAKERIYSLLPEDQKEELTAVFDEFEAGETAESRFARALDNFQPLLLNNSNGGGDWKEHDVEARSVYRRHLKTAKGSHRLYEITDQILRENIRKGNLRQDGPLPECPGSIKAQETDAADSGIRTEATFDYRLLLEQVISLTEDVQDQISNLANTAALLYDSLEDVNWAGFYILKENVLVLGPFAGKPACVKIPLGKGVCGTAAQKKETIVVPDVHRFAGHIACDSASRSEIVIPLLSKGGLFGVLDIDSPHPGRFTQADRLGLEAIAKELEKRI